MTTWYAGFAMCKQCITYDPNEKGEPTAHNHPDDHAKDHGEEYELSLYPDFKYARNAVGSMMEYLVPEFLNNVGFEDYMDFMTNILSLSKLREEDVPERTIYHYSPKESPYAFMLIREEDYGVIPSEESITFKVVADHSKCTVGKCYHDTVQ